MRAGRYCGPSRETIGRACPQSGQEAARMWVPLFLSIMLQPPLGPLTELTAADDDQDEFRCLRFIHLIITSFVFVAL